MTSADSPQTLPGEVDARTPLLSEQHTSHVTSDSRTTRFQLRVLLLVCVSIVAADFGNFLSYAPSIAIYEELICRHIRGTQSAPGVLGEGTWRCKSPDVQSELAFLNAWKDTFDQLPGIFLAIFYGYMADRIGRKPVLLLSLTGLALEEVSIRLICWWNEFVPLRAIWLTPIFQIIGGGPQVATSMAYVIITDVFQAEKRASVFFLMGAAILLGEILATPISAGLMSRNPWLPSLAGVAVQLFGFAAALALPETNPEPSDLISEQPTTDYENFESPDARDVNHLPAQKDKKTWKAKWDVVNEHLPTANMLCIVGAFLLSSIGRQALQFIIQYASRRFEWSIARASFLITIKGVVTLFMLLICLPKVSIILSGRMSPAEKDLRIVQGSVLSLTLGVMLMALAAHPALFIFGVILLAIGWGFYSALRSLATEVAVPGRIGLINTTIGFAQSIGTMIAGPLLATAFRHSMNGDGVWQGLPYMVAAVLFFGASCLSFCVRLRRQNEQM